MYLVHGQCPSLLFVEVGQGVVKVRDGKYLQGKKRVSFMAFKNILFSFRGAIRPPPQSHR